MNKHRPIHYLDFLMLAIALISFTSVISLCLNFFYAKLAVISGLLLCGLAFLIWNHNKIEFPTLRSSVLIGLLILCALFFRTTPALFIMGGADEGTYVNMSGYYNTHPGAMVYDNLRISLPPVLRENYDLHNFVGPKGGNGGAHLPGVMVNNIDKSQYVFQFYPVHPLWMAIFSNLFGQTEGPWSLVMFSLLSIIFFSLIAYELSHHNLVAGAIGGILMALNPLHIYFSKFPVSEVVAMAFVLSSLYYLIIYWKLLNEHQYVQPFYLILSALLLGCSFFVRIDGFIITAWFSVLFLILLANHRNILEFKYLFRYFLAIGILYGLSVSYGLHWDYYYATTIYKKIFYRIFLGHFILGLTTLTIIYFSIAIALWHLPSSTYNRLTHYYYRRANQLLVGIIFFIMLLALYRLYQISFTDILSKTFPHLPFPSFIGLQSLHYSSALVLAHYISWPGSLLFIYGLYKNFKEKPNIITTGLLLLTAMGLFYSTVENFAIPLQYFFLRFFFPITMFCILLLITLTLSAPFNYQSKSLKARLC